MLFQAVIWMNLALIFYTWAVFSARKKGLHRKHLFIFGSGLICDYLGTHLMLRYGLSTGIVPEWHIVIGIASLSGMGFHFSAGIRGGDGPQSRSSEPSVPSRQFKHLHGMAHCVSQPDQLPALNGK